MVVISLQVSLEQRAVLQSSAEPTERRTGVKVQSAWSLDHTHFIVCKHSIYNVIHPPK